MKRIIKSKKIKYLVFTIIGIIIGSSVGVVTANYLLSASDVEYVDKDNKSTTVQRAITDLYSKVLTGGNSNDTFEVDEDNISVLGYDITIPFVNSYPNIYCIYGTTSDYGTKGTINGNTCVITGNDTQQTLYYKIVAVDNAGKIYEFDSSSETANDNRLGTLAKVGDYVYLKPDKTSYSISSSYTGCTSSAKNRDNTDACGGIKGASQTIDPSELEIWRVIRKNDDSTVDIISDHVSSNDVYFYGQTGYAKLVGTLNTIASQYTKSGYVKSTRHMGYKDQTANLSTSKLSTSSAPWTSDTDWAYGCTGPVNNEERYGSGDCGYTTDVDLVTAVYGTTSTTTPSGTSVGNWYASRAYGYTGGTWSFKVRSSHNTHGEHIYWYNGSSFSSNSYAYAIRPILTINANVKIVGGTGVSGDEYQLSL